MSDSFGLKRVLGLGELVAIEIGTTVGAGIFSLTALAAGFTGPSAPLAFVAAAIPIVFIMMTVAMMGSAMPTVGGTYRYPSRLFSPRWATVGVWCYALGLVFGALPMYATECAHYLGALWPGLPPRGAAIAILTVFYLVNLFGISIAAGFQAIMVLVLLVALVVFGVGGLPHIDAANFANPFSGGAGGFVVSACILTFALQGSNSVIELGAEIKRPGRNIPLSLLIAIPTVTVLYVLVSTSAVGVMDVQSWTAYPNPNLSQPAAEFLSGPLFLFFMIGGAMFAFTTTLNGTFMWATKSLMVVAKDGLMPKVLARTSKLGTPALFLTLLWALSTAAVLLDAGIKTFASYATIGGMIIFIPSMIAAILLPRRAPGPYRAAGFKLEGVMLWAAPIIGIVTSVLLILILLVDLKYWALPFLAWFALGFGFYSLKRRSIERKTGKPFLETVEEDLASMIEEAQAALRENRDENGGEGATPSGV